MNDITDLRVIFASIITPIIKQAVFESLNERLPAPKPEHDDERFITRQDAAKLLGVGLVTLDKMAKFGALKKYRNGSIVRFKKSEVLDTYKTFEKRKRHQFENVKPSEAKNL